MVGTFGDIACYSLQTFKHINAGEGGILVTHDEDVAARAILHSGSYMLYAQNGTPPDEAVFERYPQAYQPIKVITAVFAVVTSFLFVC